MDREILFRGKREDNGEWVEGFYWKDIWGDNTEYIYYDGEDYEVIPETVGQYIGKDDKNGKKIFDRGIVKFRCFGADSIGKVVFNTKTCGFEIWRNITIGAYGEKATNTINFAHVDEIEVIGNIHDNPELLEVSE